MHVVASTEHRAATTEHAFAGIPLSVVFADGDEIRAVRERRSESIRLTPPFHVSDQDAYLVIPDDIGVELVDIFRDGDLDLVHEAVRDGLLVLGAMERRGRGLVELEIDEWTTPAEALAKGLPYAAEITAGPDTLEDLNGLEHVQCTIASAFVDDDGLDAMLRANEWAGTSWKVAESAPAELRGIDPTFAWTRKLAPGRVGIELALFLEYDEMVVLLRPAVIEAP